MGDDGLVESLGALGNALVAHIEGALTFVIAAAAVALADDIVLVVVQALCGLRADISVSYLGAHAEGSEQRCGEDFLGHDEALFMWGSSS